MNSCGGPCIKYKASKVEGRRRYAAGQKRCNECNLFMYYDGIHCPCCNKKLRISPRSSKAKREYLEQTAK